MGLYAGMLVRRWNGYFFGRPTPILIFPQPGGRDWALEIAIAACHSEESSDEEPTPAQMEMLVEGEALEVLVEVTTLSYRLRLAPG